MAVQLKTENKIDRLVFVDDGYEQTLSDELKAPFQKHLPLSKRHVLPGETEEGDANGKCHRNSIKLYRCAETGGKYRVTELKSGPLMQSDLDPKVFDQH